MGKVGFWLRWWVGGLGQSLGRWGGVMSSFFVLMAGPGIGIVC